MAFLEHFGQLYAQHPLVFFHMLCAVGALGLGAWQLARTPRGDDNHRIMGWAWVLLMAGTAVTSAFIREYHMPNIWGFGPIHLFTLFVAINLPLAVYAAKKGNIQRHRKAMRGLFIGGCVVAGMFTLMPTRFLGNLLWHQLLNVA
jgi:uncharacterized membrane protein